MPWLADSIVCFPLTRRKIRQAGDGDAIYLSRDLGTRL